jgi:hypothetical protein
VFVGSEDRHNPLARGGESISHQHVDAHPTANVEVFVSTCTVECDSRREVQIDAGHKDVSDSIHAQNLVVGVDITTGHGICT